MSEKQQTHVLTDVTEVPAGTVAGWHKTKAIELLPKLPTLLKAAKSEDDGTRVGALAALNAVREQVRANEAMGTSEDVENEMALQADRVLEQAQSGTFQKMAGENGEADVDILKWAADYLQKHTLELTERQLEQPGAMQVSVPSQKPPQK